MLEIGSFNRRRFLKVAGSLGFLSGTSETVAAAQQSRVERDELLVGVAPSANARRTAERALPTEARIIDENTTLGYVRAELPKRASPTAKAQVADAVANRAGVEYAEPNAVYEAFAVPNDPRFDDQYAPQMVNAPEVWNTSFEDDEVIIAVVDTGIKYDHPDLQENFGDVKGYDFVDGDDDPYPDDLTKETHGTHVAGIAAARIDNGIGIAGISNATLLGVRALDESQSGYISDIADGIQWATDRGADVINLSLGGSSYSETLQRAVSYAYEKGVLLVAAAGNDYGGSVSYPAAHEECIAVSALDANESFASYSNEGSKVELAAPGTDLLSTWNDDGYRTHSGTSMAAPVVSGVGALILSKRDFVNTEVRSHLKNTAVDVGLQSTEQGSGRVDATASTNDQESVLTIEGSGSRTDYSFSVSGNVEAVEVNDHDTVSSNRAEGFVGGGTDRYAFSGELLSFSLEGDATTYLNGSQIDPREYPDHLLTIEGTGSRTDYRFRTAGDVAPIETNDHDTVYSDGAEGLVGGGTDRYAFAGELALLALDGDARVFLDGQRIDPDKYPNRFLEIRGTGSRADYRFSVSGSLEPVEVNDHETVRADSAEGLVGGSGTDRYAFSGELLSLTLDGDAAVYIDGREIDPSYYSKKSLIIAGSETRTDYRFSVSGSIDPVEVNDHDTIQQSSAEGLVGGGTDQYEFSGELNELVLEGSAHATINQSTGTITIAGTGQATSYQFSVSENVEAVDVNNHDTVSGDGAEGFVGGGTDRYAFSGELLSFTLDGTTVTVKEKGERSGELPTLGIYSGLSDSDFDLIRRMEEWQNTPYSIQNLFVPWNPDEGHMNWLFDHVLPKISDSGRVPLITWEPFTPDAESASVDEQALVERGEYDAYLQSLADTTSDNIEVQIKNGEYDQYIDRWASRLREWLAGPDGTLGTGDDREAYIRLGHEMNGDWYPWAPTVGGNSPGDYVGMWQRVHSRFERKNIGSRYVQWMWCVNAEDVGSYTAEQLYPGKSYVDWFAIDGYNWGQSQNWSSWQSPDEIYGDMLGRLRGITDKPVCIGEFASTSMTSSGYDPTRKGEWIRSTLEYFRQQDLDMHCWFNEDKETDWAVFDSERGTETVNYSGGQVDAYAAFRKMINTSETGINSTTSKVVPTEQALSDD